MNLKKRKKAIPIFIILISIASIVVTVGISNYYISETIRCFATTVIVLTIIFSMVIDIEKREEKLAKKD